MRGPDREEPEKTQSEAPPPGTPASTAQQQTGSAVQICCELNARYFETASAPRAQEYAQRSGGRIYSWKTVGVSEWLEVGVARGDLLGLLVLPPGLPDIIDLNVGGDDEAVDDRDYPVVSALIEGMLLDVNGWLSRWGFSYRLPTFFRPGSIFTHWRNSPARNRLRRAGIRLELGRISWKADDR